MVFFGNELANDKNSLKKKWFQHLLFWNQMQIICKSQKTKKSGPFLVV